MTISRESQLPACLVALALTLIVSTHHARASLPYEIALDGKSYTFKVDITTRSSRGEINGYELEEFHSDWQRRTRIDFRVKGPAPRVLARRGVIFATDKQVFMVNQERLFLKPCTRIERNLVDKAFQLDQFLLLGEPQAYEMGTVRLLLWLARQSQSFAPQADKRNAYKATLGSFTITVSYSRAASLPLGLPSKVLIEREDKFSMVVKYKQVVPLAINELVWSGSQLPAARKGDKTGTTDILFDVFALDRNYGCSIEADGEQTGAPEGPIQSALTEPAIKHRFSFKARVESDVILGPSSSMSVMYEPHVDTLRVDQQYENRAAHRLVSFAHDRVYHVMRRLNEAKDSILDSVLQMGDSSCVVAKNSLASRLTDSYTNPYTLGEMLLGAARNATYLGLAQVRGIEAHAFEAHDNQLPVWLEQPLVYQRKGDVEFRWRTGSPDESYPLVVTTIFYFARDDSSGGENGSERNIILGNRLLHIEIFKKTKLDTARGSLNISIYDFSWALHGEAPNGERTEDFLSLGDHCLAPSSEDNHYAHVNFALAAAEAAAPSNQEAAGPGWLQVPIRRNLALMSAVHDQFRVPHSLVFDIESRYAKATAASRESVVATMMAAERYEAPVTLTYLGRASVAKSRFYSVTVSGFPACFWLAAHKHDRDNLFAYHAMMSRCYIREGESNGGEDDKPGNLFELRPMGPLEVYQVSHRPDRKLLHDDFITKLEELHARMNRSQRLVLADPENAKRKMFFSIKSAQVDHLNEKIAYDLDEEHHLDDINKFPGFGLVADDKQNKIIGPRWELEPVSGGIEVTRRQMGMTFEQCQEACLMDIECRAYSTCLVRGQLECILTSVDFKVSTVVLELMELQAKTYKLGDVFPVTLVGDTKDAKANQVIHVKRHPTCELHNKLYKHLFVDAGISTVSLGNRVLRPVTHSEQCAEICFQNTLEIMRNETQRLQLINKDALVKDPGALTEYNASHCAAYLYLDKQQAADEDLTISRKQIVGKNTDGATRGYCVLDEGLKSELVPTYKQQVVELRKFVLDFSVLYEKQYGVSLVDTEKSPEEAEAFRKIFYMRDSSLEHLERMGDFLDRGGNTGKIVRLAGSRSSRDCARMCFTQVAPTWPACRSFDLIEVTNKITAAKRSLCVFNTLTVGQLQAAGTTDMILQDNQQEWVQMRGGDEVHVWHFEPRAGLVANSLEEVFQVARGEAELLFGRLLKSSSRLRMSSLGLFFTMIIVISLGFVAGARLSADGGGGGELSEILSRVGLGARRHREDKQALVEEDSSPKLTFEDALGGEQLAPPSDENGNL